MFGVPNFFLVVFLCGSTLAANDYFSIVGPRTFNHGEDYVAYVTSTGFSKPVDLKLTIRTQKDLNKVVARQTIRLPTAGEEIRLKLQSQKEFQNYTISAEIPSRNVYRNAHIYVVGRKYSVFVQTDKPMYKAGDKIQFRVLVIDSNTRPYQCEKVSTEVIDATGNIVDRSEIPKSTVGVYEGHLVLSDKPVTGVWEIQVTVDSDERLTSKKFEVREYVLPRFKAYIDIKHNDDNIEVEIYGKYSLGQSQNFVKGNATVLIDVTESRSTNGSDRHTITRSIDLVDGKKFLVFTHDDLSIQNNDAVFIEASVTIEESLTKKTATANKKTTLNKQTFQILTANKFKPGLPIDLKVIVRNVSGKRVGGNGKFVSIKVEEYNMAQSNSDSCKAESANNPDSHVKGEKSTYKARILNGEANFKIPTEESNNALSIDVKYESSNGRFTLRRAPSRSRDYIDAKVVTKKLEADSEIAIDVTTNREFNKIHTVVFGRTGAVFSKSFSFPSNQKFSFTFPASFEMTPLSHLMVYYFQPTGEIIYDRIMLKFEKQLPNNLVITPSVLEASPGEKTSFDVSSSKGSQVFVNAIDARFNSIGSNHDINMNHVQVSFLQAVLPKNVAKPAKERYPELFDSNILLLTDADQGFDCSTSRFSTSDDGEGEEKILFMEDSNTQFIETRQEFPDSWFFRSLKMNDDIQSFEEKLPDEITSWRVSGFSINQATGLAIAKPTEIVVTKKFFILVVLPQSVKVGEVAKIEVTLFNNDPSSQKIEAILTLENEEGSFEIVRVLSNCKVQKLEGETIGINKRSIDIEANSIASAEFNIRTSKPGKVRVKLSATTNFYTDAVEKFLTIETDGIAHYMSKSFLVDLRFRKFFSHYLKFNIDRTSIAAGSAGIGASAKKSTLGAPLDPNIPSDPTAKFIVSAFHLEYLKSIGKLTDEHKAELKDDMKAGYQEILKLKKSDGSFDDSVWLTAFAVKSFSHVKNWIEINDSYMINALKYLAAQQAGHGGFALDKNSADIMELTIYTTIAFLESEQYVGRFTTQVDLAINFIANNMDKVRNNFELAMAAYALVLRKNPKSEDFLSKLKTNAIRHGDMVHWNKEFGNTENATSHEVPDKIDIASYALLAFLKSEGKLDETVKVLSWLMTYRRAHGLSKDTVILQALTEAGKHLHAEDTEMDIYCMDDQDVINGMHLNNEPRFESQGVFVDPESNGLSLNANGTGLAYLDVWWKFNQKIQNASRRFIVATKVKGKTADKTLVFQVCASFIADTKQNRSGLTVMEISMPSGFEFDQDYKGSFKKLNIKKFETRENKSKIILYFDTLTSEKTCAEITAWQKFSVAVLKDAGVKVYDFVQPEMFGVDYYRPIGSNCKA